MFRLEKRETSILLLCKIKKNINNLWSQMAEWITVAGFIKQICIFNTAYATELITHI